MMLTRVLGVGVGLFVVILLWIIAFLVCFISVRTQKNFGLSVVFVATIISVILIFIPRENESESVSETAGVGKIYDTVFVWRVTLVILLGLSSVAALLIFLFTHLMEPRHAKALTQLKL